MKKINANPLQDMTVEDVSKELKEIGLGKYTIYVDLLNGDVNIGKNARCKQSELVIGKVELLDNSTKKLIKTFYSSVRKVIRDYYKSGILICRSRAVDEYSKKYVEKFNPVLNVENPHYSCAYPMSLFDTNVLKFNVEKFGSLIPTPEEKKKRRNAAEKAVQSKLNKCWDYVYDIDIEIPDFDKDSLETLAFEHWYDWKCATIDNFDLKFRSNYTEDDMKRWCVNYLRHECTTYDENLAEVYGKVGAQEAHDILQERINDAIYEKYEWLRD